MYYSDPKNCHEGVRGMRDIRGEGGEWSGRIRGGGGIWGGGGG